MTARNLFSRLTWLGVVLLCAGAVHLALTLNAEDIARFFVKPYVPLAKEQATTQAIESCNRVSMPWPSQAKDWSRPSESDILIEVQRPEERYQYSTLRPAEEKVRDLANFTLGSVYAILAVSSLWAFKTWFFANIWTKIAGFTEPVRTAINWTEMGAARRLRRTEKEFRTLKNLRDEGLITEDVFVARKDKLIAAIESN